MSTARVDFTRGAAERIASVVRRVEQGDRDGAPLTFRRVNDLMPGSPLKLGVFTADWSTGATMTVTFYNVTSTPNTATVINLCVPSKGFSTANTAEERLVIFGNVKYTSDPVAIELQQPSGCLYIGNYAMSQIGGFEPDTPQILGHDGTCLVWYDVHTCPSTAT